MANRSTILSLDFESEFFTMGDERAGIWQSTLSVTQADRDASFWVANFGFPWGDYLSLETVTVGSVKDRDVFYPELFSLDELDIVDYGFYFDTDAQILYVATPRDEYWWTRVALDYGQSFRFIDHAQNRPDNKLPMDAYIDGVICEPRLIPEGMSYKNTADKLENNRMDFNNCSVSVINADGLFDNATGEIIGRGMRVFVGYKKDYEVFTSLSEYEEVFNGIVGSITYPNGETATVKGDDPRKHWDGNVDSGVMSVDEFPAMDPSYEEKMKPIIIGDVRKIPLINVSSTTDSLTWYLGSDTFGLCTATDIYIGDDPSPYTGTWTQTPGTNLIVLDADPGSSVFADVTGPMYTSPVNSSPSISVVDICLFYLGEFANLPFLPSFYDVGAITTIQARSPDASIYIDKPVSVKKVVDMLLSSGNTRIFQKGIASEGNPIRQLYSMRDLDITGFEPTEQGSTLEPFEMVALPIPWRFDDSTFASVVRASYDIDYRSDTPTQIVLRDKELTALNNHPIPRVYDYTAYLNDGADVTRLADERYEEYITVKYRLAGQYTKDIDFDLMDYVYYWHQRDGGIKIINPAIWRVVAIDKLQQTFELELYLLSVPVTIPVFNAKMYGPVSGMYLDNQSSIYGDFNMSEEIDYIFEGIL